MEALREKAVELLASGAVQVIIGYGRGSRGGARAIFARTAEQAGNLIYDGNCLQNLAVYLLKPEVRALGKPALVARPATLRTLVQLASENQIREGDFVALTVDQDGTLTEFTTLKAIEEYVQAGKPEEKSREEIERLRAMPRAERWQFWMDELSRCLKCYACRASCPLCYCERCAVECNQPQWVSAAPTPSGNFEWHVVRAMHLAGRCIGCGDCARACPVAIPLNLLTQEITEEISADFGQKPGMSVEAPYTLSSFKPEDKEDFIR